MKTQFSQAIEGSFLQLVVYLRKESSFLIQGILNHLWQLAECLITVVKTLSKDNGADYVADSII